MCESWLVTHGNYRNTYIEEHMKITDPDIIKHLEEGYYISRRSWPKDQGYWWHSKSGVQFECGPMGFSARGFSLDDLKADDWYLCPKE